MNGRLRAVAGAAAAVVLVIGRAAAAPGAILQETLPGTGVRYTLAVPADRTAGAGAPLVVSLHYGGPVSPWYGRGLLEAVVEPALRPLGAVMVAPDCPQRSWAECAQALEDVVDLVQARHGTAPGCVVLTGYSKGGIGTWALASRAPRRYAAAIVMAARAPDDPTLAGWRVPVRVIHGADDELFPAPAVSAAVERLRAAGVDAQLRVLDGVSHYDTHRFADPLSEQIEWLRARCAGKIRGHDT